MMWKEGVGWLGVGSTSSEKGVRHILDSAGNKYQEPVFLTFKFPPKLTVDLPHQVDHDRSTWEGGWGGVLLP